MQRVKILDKEFELSIPSSVIHDTIDNIADRLNSDLKGKDVVFIGILNGVFMFVADLFKRLDFDCEISFLKLSSYDADRSTGKVNTLIGINEEIKGRTVVLTEDIVDTGVTLEHAVELLKEYDPLEIRIATLLFKPDAYIKDININYIGLKIPDSFIIGYGLDYKGYGRNYQDIYAMCENSKL